MSVLENETTVCGDEKYQITHAASGEAKQQDRKMAFVCSKGRNTENLSSPDSILYLFRHVQMKLIVETFKS